MDITLDQNNTITIDPVPTLEDQIASFVRDHIRLDVTEDWFHGWDGEPGITAFRVRLMMADEILSEHIINVKD